MSAARSTMIRAPEGARDVAALGALRALLDELRYAETIAAVTHDAPAHLLRAAGRRLADRERPADIDPHAWAPLSLFFLGQPASEPEARALLGDAFEPLVELGLLERQGEAVRCDRYAVVPVTGLPFVVSRLSHARTQAGAVAAYLGLDTLELAERALAEPAGSMLDLGCGAGIVGILAALARPGRRVLGTELSPEATRVARVNAALHGARYEAREGDLYATVAGERFDLIVADPPSVAISDELAFPVYGDGGPDGDALLRRIFAGAEAHLEPGGRLIAITELQCAPGRIPFLDWSRRFVDASPGRHVRVEVRASRRIPADWHRALGDGLVFLPGWDGRCDDAGERLAAFAAARGIAFGFWIHAELHVRPAAASSHEVRWAFPRATERSRPRKPLDDAAFERRFGAFYSGSPAAFDDLLPRFLDRATGDATIGEIARSLGGSDAGLHVYLADLTTAFAQIGLLTFDPESLPAVTS